jgi:RNA polymerase sigma-70 factor, ECF subfamily
MDEVTRWALVARESLDRAGSPAGRREHDDAIARLVVLTQADVWRFVAKLTDSTRADDLTQETYLRAWRSLRNFRGESSARTWLLGVANHVVADHVRTSARRTGLLGKWGLRLVPNADVANDRLRQVVSTGGLPEAHGIDELVANLPDDVRVPFVLTQVIGATYAEAAEICDCPVGTVRSRVFRARELLIAALAASEAV